MRKKTPRSTSKTLARSIASAASDRKAVDLIVLDLTKLSAFTDFFVICTGNSDRHVQAIADSIEDAMRKKGVRLIGEEGYRLGHWVVLDYADVVAHIFHPTEREHYRLDRLWHDVPRVTMKGITS